jgi:hypothetical protein
MRQMATAERTRRVRKGARATTGVAAHGRGVLLWRVWHHRNETAQHTADHPPFDATEIFDSRRQFSNSPFDTLPLPRPLTSRRITPTFSAQMGGGPQAERAHQEGIGGVSRGFRGRVCFSGTHEERLGLLNGVELCVENSEHLRAAAGQ